MPKSPAMIASFRNPADQLVNLAALMHQFQTIADVERCWPRVVATLQWVARRRQLTYDHLIAAVDWLTAATRSGPFAGDAGEPYRLELEALIGDILGKAPATEWDEPEGDGDANDWPEAGDGSQEPGDASIAG
jgi:hypothetical protein